MRPELRNATIGAGQRMKGGDTVSDQQVRETLEKQLQLLSERSIECAQEQDLASLTCEMVKIAAFLASLS